MLPARINTAKQTLGFLSMTIGWAVINIIYSVYYGFTRPMEKESLVMIFWSGLFMFIAWAIFIIFPLRKLDHSKKLFSQNIFPFIGGVYATLVFVILVGGIFRDVELIEHEILYSFIAGVVFGICYSQLIHSEMVVNLINDKPIYEFLSFLSPAIIVGFFLWLLPTLFPSYMFRFMTDGVQNKIFEQAFVKYKVGDDFNKLNNDVPYFFYNDIQNNNVNTMGNIGSFQYQLEVKNGRITKISHSIENY